MKYIGFSLDENSKAVECPVCGNEETKEGDYCKICGTHLVNKCTRSYENYEGCGRLAEGNARYCAICGSKTTFFRDGLFKAWNNGDNNSERIATTPSAWFEKINSNCAKGNDDDLPF